MNATISAGIDASGVPCTDCGDPPASAADLRLLAIQDGQRRIADAISTLSTAQAAIVQRLDEGAKRMDAMQAELAQNTAMTQAVRDASTFVRVGTSVVKWLGVIAIAVGSVVVGWKMAATGSPMPHDVGIGPK